MYNTISNRQAQTPAIRSDNPPHVALLAVSKTFGTRGNGVVEALREITLSVGESQFVSILGPSGCGKTTLLNLVAGLDEPSAGRVTVQGSEVHGAVSEAGVVFQRDLLLPWRTVLQNVMLQAEIRGLPRREASDRARLLIELVGLGEFEDRFPFELSGGMRQRAAICRALLHEPSLLLMDEPFGALDAITRDQMNLELQRLWQASPTTVVFVTHSTHEAIFLADRVVIMTPRPGTIAADVSIDLKRPRRLVDRESTKFVRCVAEVQSVLVRTGGLVPE
jgi:NitT/TauT family transport system ATP-binding protein